MLSHDLGRQEFGNPTNVNNVLTRDEAMTLLNDWVKNDRLRLHMLQVGYLMKQWALQKENADERTAWKWEMAGMLHDADWDQWPDQHCKKIIEELENRNVDPGVIHAIASHGHTYFGVEPVTQMDKMLYAFDELSGFIHAYSLMRPNGYEGMDVKGVKKRLKDKTFAANVSRDDIQDASTRANISMDDVIQFAVTNQTEMMKLQ